MCLKQEKGSITLFVLVAMLFFITVTLSAYIMASNKLQGQNEEIVQIKQSYEQDLTDEGLAELYEKASASEWIDNGDRTFTKGNVTVNVGDYINYTLATDSYTSPTGTYISDSYASAPSTIEQGSGYETEQTFNTSNYTGGWRVLGVEDGKLKLISADPVPLSTGNTDYYLRGYTGATYGMQELNNACAKYGTGTYAESARSVNVDDINKITGYNPNNVGEYDPDQTGSGTNKYGSGEMYEYGNDVTYTWGTSSGYITSSGTLNSAGVTDSATYASDYSTHGFNYHNANYNSLTWTSNVFSTSGSKICTLKSTYYYYYPNSLTISSSDTTVTEGIGSSGNTYNTLFCNSGGTNVKYWLASPFVNTNADNANFGLLTVYSDGSVYGYDLYTSNGVMNSYNHGVRPVVILQSDVTIDKTDGKDGATKDTAYTLK